MKKKFLPFAEAAANNNSKPQERKVPGLLGGLGWPSTLTVYEAMNREANERLSGHNTIRMRINSVDIGPMIDELEVENWDVLGDMLAEEAKILEQAGADFVFMPCNTMHRVADKIEQNLSIPFVHIADSVAMAIKDEGLSKVALLGSVYTMKLDFYKDKLREDHGIEAVAPTVEEQKVINDIIFNELLHNDIRESSRQEYLKIIDRLAQEEGCQGVILGCTEIGLLVKQENRPDMPMFDTTLVHAERALNIALGVEALQPKLEQEATFENKQSMTASGPAMKP